MNEWVILPNCLPNSYSLEVLSRKLRKFTLLPAEDEHALFITPSWPLCVNGLKISFLTNYLNCFSLITVHFFSLNYFFTSSSHFEQIKWNLESFILEVLNPFSLSKEFYVWLTGSKNTGVQLLVHSSQPRKPILYLAIKVMNILINFMYIY